MKYLFLALLVFTPYASQAQAQNPYAGINSVEVFANSAMNITLPERKDFVKIYRVDGMARLEEEINSQMPHQEKEARQWVSQHAKEMQLNYREQALNAANGITMSMHYKLNRIPAMVINGKVIIYGMTSVPDAINRYQALKR